MPEMYRFILNTFSSAVQYISQFPHRHIQNKKAEMQEILYFLIQIERIHKYDFWERQFFI